MSRIMRAATQRPIVIAHAVPMERGEDIVYKWSGNKEIGEDMVYKWSGNKEMGESWNTYHFKGWVKKGKKRDGSKYIGATCDDISTETTRGVCVYVER